MAFQFGFQFPTNDSTTAMTASDVNIESDKEEPILKPAKHIPVLPLVNLHQERPSMKLDLGHTCFQLVQSGTIVSETAHDHELRDILVDSDLEPGVYEGGFKVWECAIDLVHYLRTRDSIVDHQTLDYSTVLELGCGHALPSLYCLAHHHESMNELICTDYNEQVLEAVTCPNLRLNSVNDIQPHVEIRCYAGDWQDVSQTFLVGQGQSSLKCSLILSAETLYTEAIAVKVAQMIASHLSYPKGKALIAAKKYYFGTGGSVQHFVAYVNANLPQLKAEIVWDQTDGRSNIREIVQVTFH